MAESVSDEAAGWTTKELRFDSQQWQDNLSVDTVSVTSLRRKRVTSEGKAAEA
jgi:hypothetical protein